MEMPHNQMILNTGEHHTGIIFAPFIDETPASLAEEATFTSTTNAPRRVSIGGVQMKDGQADRIQAALRF